MSSEDKNGDLDSDWIQKTTRLHGFVMEEKSGLSRTQPT